jgi:hypothetical protein
MTTYRERRMRRAERLREWADRATAPRWLQFLRERLAAEEAAQARMVAINRALGQHRRISATLAEAEYAALFTRIESKIGPLSEHERQELRDAVRFTGEIGYSSGVIANGNNRIRKLRERISRLEREQAP